jgi:hypothetical protein
VIKDRSRAARERLKLVETQMEEARDKAAELNKRLDSMTSASVKRKLDSLSDVLSQSPLNIAEANRALKQAVRKMVLDPARGQILFIGATQTSPSRRDGLSQTVVPLGRGAALGKPMTAREGCE